MAKGKKGGASSSATVNATADAPKLVEALTKALPEDPPDKYDLRSSPEGKALFATQGEVRKAIVLALLPAITKAYEVQRDEKKKAEAPASRDDWKYDAVFAARGRMTKLHKLLVELLRANLTFTPADVDGLFGWVGEQEKGHFLYLPDEPLVKLAEQLAKEKVGFTARAQKGLKAIRASLKRVAMTADKRKIEKLDKVLARPAAKLSTTRQDVAPAGPSMPQASAKPAPADTRPAEAEAARLVLALPGSWPKGWEYPFKPEKWPSGQALFAADPAVRAQAVVLMLEWLREREPKNLKVPGVPQKDIGPYHQSYARDVLAMLLRAKLPFTAQGAARMFKMVASSSSVSPWSHPLAGIVAVAERLNESGELADAGREQLARIRRKMEEGVVNAESRKLAGRLSALVQGEAGTLNFVAPGEAWSDRALADYAAMKEKPKAAWLTVLQHAVGATSAKPSDAWEGQARKLIEALGKGEFTARVLAWFPLVEKPRTAKWPHAWANTPQTDMLVNDSNADVVRGLAWMCPMAEPSADVCRALGRLCETSLKKLPGMGPRLPKLANAAVYALGRIAGEHALGQLARLKTRVTFRTTLQQIEKALDQAAARLGITKADLEELGVPAYGFDDNGVRRETFDGATCELKLEGRKVVTTWTNDKGKVVKSPPTGVKEKYAEDLKELKLAATDAEKMLTAQRDRIDSLMGLPKTWKLEDFRERYLGHPLAGQIARRLIWVADGVPVLFSGEDATDVSGKKVKLGKTAEVALWHPAGRKADEIVAWRRRLEELRITQPFKQAHREVYLLTDAERRTRTYSNRFAAHVIRQHQFHALAAQRGWRNKLRLMVDDEYPPASKELPAFGLRAEFWVEGVGDDYGTDTTESGSYLRLSTDQVRFYRTGAAPNTAHAGGGGYTTNARERGAGGINEPLPLEEVPPLAFSEVMRDVDLFVGVASVGNDPTWQDGGPAGRYRDYWQSYSFGELSATAQTRKSVLQNLLPRLTRLRGRASLDDRFLVVRGDLRTYKIHLGSGNILMEPNDQYLCIVPDRSSTREGPGDVFLPFEGDGTLAIILSKAFLLSEDKAIKDPTIARQIKAE
jgi:hypothetical protein